MHGGRGTFNSFLCLQVEAVVKKRSCSQNGSKFLEFRNRFTFYNLLVRKFGKFRGRGSQRRSKNVNLRMLRLRVYTFMIIYAHVMSRAPMAGGRERIWHWERMYTEPSFARRWTLQYACDNWTKDNQLHRNLSL